MPWLTRHWAAPAILLPSGRVKSPTEWVLKHRADRVYALLSGMQIDCNGTPK